nr:transcriptional regulator, SARP family [Kibdelosporangium sp. MJ126-NF4]
MQLSGKPTAVLVALLLQANRSVSHEQLTDAVWDDQLPNTAVAALRTYVSRARRALADIEPGTMERIVPQPNGYLIRVRPGELDLELFRAHAERGRVAAAAGESTTALDDFEAGLGLWRASARTEWTGTLGQHMADLDEEYFAAAEQQIELKLAVGESAGLIPQLTSLITAHPLRERLREHLMLALYRSGRQSDALAVYQDVHQLLDQELGVRPGPGLRELHQRMLAEDPTLVSVRETVAVRTESQPDGTAVPFQLPADTVHFTGRSDQVSRLLGLWPAHQNGNPPGTVVISAVEGMAGVGKTTLAVHAAHRLSSKFDDGVLFIDLHGFTPGADPVTPEHALDYLLRGLGLSGNQIPSDLDARAALYRSVLARRRVLVVLDNAADETQLRPLLPAARGCGVLVTSRRHLAGLDDAVHFNLPVLPADEAAALFHALVADRATPADARIIEDIVSLCGHLPLAIRIAAARLRSNQAGTPARLLAELTDVLATRQGLDWLSDGHRAVSAALSVSYSHLTPDQQHAFRLLGLHPGVDIEPYALAALADTTINHARQLLEHLHSASLTIQTDYQRYTLHDLVATYATSLAHDDPEPDQRAALDRLFALYAYTTSAAMASAFPWDAAYPWETDERPHIPAPGTPTPPLDDDTQALHWLDTELANLLATAHHAPHYRRPDHTSHQSTTLHRYFRVRSRYTDARAVKDLALLHASTAGDRVAEHHALACLSTIHLWQGRYDLCADYGQKALDMAREMGNRAGELDALHAIGCVHTQRNQFASATDYLERALTIALETGNRLAELDLMHSLGGIHQSLGQYDKATACYQRTLTISRDIEHHGAAQYALRGLANIQWLQGQPEPAIDTYHQVLAMTRTVNNPTSELFTLCALGNVHRQLEQYQTAGDYYQQALAIALQTGDQARQIEAHQGIGRVQHATGRHNDALLRHRTALELATELGQPANQANAHDGLAHAHQALGDTTQSRHHWCTALKILTNLNLTHTDEPDVTTATIKAHLAALDKGQS